MATAHVNHYRRRLVAQANEKPCTICNRPTDCVLMSTDSKDFFYCCPLHLKDKGFATPIVDAAEQERLKQVEIAKVKAEYEEKQRRKAEQDKANEKKEDDKVKSSSSWLANPFSRSKNADKDKPVETTIALPAPEPKEFALHRTLYLHRVNLKVQAAQQKARDAQWSTLQFPSAPSK